jgi:hypothetical protein
MVNVKVSTAAGALSGQRVRERQAHAQRNGITKGLAVKAQAELIQWNKRKP